MTETSNEPETAGDRPDASAAAPDRSALAVVASDIKLSHSVFALPFALLAVFLAAGGFPGTGQLLLIVVCMFFARTFAMLANRYFDRELDARNPRTAGRALPSGRLSSRQAVGAMALSGGAFIAAAAGFAVAYGNFWPLWLSPAVLGFLAAYGLMKRFTAACHFFLGAALAISPLAAALAIDPSALDREVFWWLAGFVMLWVAGFDVVYALQDLEVDRRDGLHSVPAKLGPTGALLVAKTAHVAALAALVAAGMREPMLAGGFKVGVVIVAILLVVEHRAAKRGSFQMAFFTLNGVISLLLGGLGIYDVLRH